jgi:hypothetical protein
MTKFKITSDVEMHKFFEQPPQSASPFPEVSRVFKTETRKCFTAFLECWSSEIQTSFFIVTWALEVTLDNR